MTAIPHRFTRPAWLCADCGEPWPCQPRRQALLAEHADARTALHTLMSGFLGDAIEDLPDVPVEALWPRFLGWVRTTALPQPAPQKDAPMNTAHPAFKHGQSVAKIARGEPGAWVDLAGGLTTTQADNKVHRVRKERGGAFKPAGSFDARKCKRDDGTFLVQVRYVGQPHP